MTRIPLEKKAVGAQVHCRPPAPTTFQRGCAMWSASSNNALPCASACTSLSVHISTSAAHGDAAGVWRVHALLLDGGITPPSVLPGTNTSARMRHHPHSAFLSYLSLVPNQPDLGLAGLQLPGSGAAPLSRRPTPA
jgi:hypothetical protein